MNLKGKRGIISGRIDIQMEIEPVKFDDMDNRALDRPQTFGVAL